MSGKALLLLLGVIPAHPGIRPLGAVAYFDFAKGTTDLADSRRSLTLHGATWGRTTDPMQATHGPALEFTTSSQFGEFQLQHSLDGVKSVSIGGWFYTRRWGEQAFASRGEIEIASGGQRIFRPRNDWVDFMLGTDQHGFFMAALNGNATTPFPFVTLNDVAINTWNQLAIVKTADGFQKFYQNGALIHTDLNAATSPVPRPFDDHAAGEPVRLTVPQGGMIGEVWIYPRELTDDEIRSGYEEKQAQYQPTIRGRAVSLRRMDERASAHLWDENIDGETWPRLRSRIAAKMTAIFGAFPPHKVPLNPASLSEEDMGDYIRRKVSIQVQANDRMPAYILIPKKTRRRTPAIICFYSTSSGAGKDTTVGLSGPRPGTPVAKNRDFAVTMVKAGYIAFAPDYLRDGERIKTGRTVYDTTDFYESFPNWSVHGKDAWDTMRAIDYLQTLDFVDPTRIGMVGHSYGGHSTIFCAAFDPRIKVAVSNGAVSDFIHHGLHWAVPPGAKNSQSLPTLRPFILEKPFQIPLTFYQVTSLIAPRPLLVGQAVGERRPMEEENAAAVNAVYRGLGYPDRVRYNWYAGDHDFPPEAQQAAVEWFNKWFALPDAQQDKRPER